ATPARSPPITRSSSTAPTSPTTSSSAPTPTTPRRRRCPRSAAPSAPPSRSPSRRPRPRTAASPSRTSWSRRPRRAFRERAAAPGADMIGAKSLATLTLLVLAVVAAPVLGLLSPERLATRGWGTLFVAGCFAAVVGTLIFRFWRLGERSQHYFRWSSEPTPW